MINKELLRILACPFCKESVALRNQTILCKGCGRVYPIKDDIPIMLTGEAKINEQKEKK